MLAAIAPTADLTDEERDHLGREGYLLRASLFSRDECEKLSAACELAVSAVLADGRRHKVEGASYPQEYRPRLRALVKWEPNAPALIQGIEPCSHLSRTIQAFGNDERLLGPARAIVGRADIAPFTEKLNLKRAHRGGAFAIHQDFPYWAPATKHADLIATAMVYLDEASQQSGCLELAPGSHLEGLQTCKSGAGAGDLEMDPRAFDLSRLKPIGAPAGSVIFFGSMLVHRSAPNRSDQDRRALLYSYQPAGEKHLRHTLRG
jgi:hypothetical protein